MTSVKFIAHRGLSGSYPENTMIAFEQAWAHNCDGIELDIQVSKDAQVLVIHDPTTKRTADIDMTIADSSYAQLQTINVGISVKGNAVDPQQIPPQRISLLTTVIDAMPTGKLIQIEIKHHISNIQAVIDCLTDIRTDIDIQVISYQPLHLLQVKNALPHFDYFLVIDQHNPPIENRIQFAIDNGLTGLDMDYQIATPEFVSEVIRSGLHVAHWTVNDVNDAKRLIDQGATYIASDYAHQLADQLT